MLRHGESVIPNVPQIISNMIKIEYFSVRHNPVYFLGCNAAISTLHTIRSFTLNCLCKTMVFKLHL